MPATAGEVLQAARARLEAASSHPRRDAEALLAHALRCNQIDLFAHPERILTQTETAQFDSFLARRLAHEPIQYIIGEQEFYGLIFRVTPAVLIPRPETEHLVEAVLKRAHPAANLRIVDLGTGSGAIAVALARSLPQTQVNAIDLSLAALEIAGANVARHGVSDRVALLQSDLLASAQGQEFDIVVSNPPYIAQSELLEPQVARYEPHAALFAGPTGLEIYQRLIPQACHALKSGGWLILEIGYGQSQPLLGYLKEWDTVTIENDLQGIPRIISAQKP